MSAEPQALTVAVRNLVTAGFGVKVSKRGRILIQTPLFASGAETEAAVTLVLSSPAAEVKRVIPKAPRTPRRARGRRS